MTNKLKLAAVAFALLAAPRAVAADSPAGSTPASSTVAMATMLCRPAAAGERAVATTMNANTALACKQVDAMMRNGQVVGPDLSRALTVDQVDAAWRDYYLKAFVVPVTGGG